MNGTSTLMSHNPKILTILQARTSSSRLPGKVMLPILEKPMLARQLERVRRARLIGNLLVATSTDKTDDSVESLCLTEGVNCHRGSLDDVLDRFYQAAIAENPDIVVRLTGDCPLADPEVIDAMIGFFLSGDYDYASNAIEPTFPDGLDVEVFRFSCLKTAWEEARLPSQREHVTLFIHGQPDRFRVGSFCREPNIGHLRWTVDEPADLEFVRRVYETLYPKNPGFGITEVLGLLSTNPEIGCINTGINRNEGLQKSLERDPQSGR